ncbi:MAG: hypothetical protein E6G85_30265 [Alphaproteobacteria bacterium]|nr:MAG: hypothetical protein E6G85_30265 [Alphaproteobacteria bacterium]
MLRLRHDDPLALSLGGAIRNGDLASLNQLVREHPDLVTARIEKSGKARAPLHVATDWPGRFPNGPAVITALIDAGADPNARCEGMYHTETPLHWVASSDDVEAFEVLVKAGADIEALGGSIGGGTPLDNAVGYGQWQVARRLVECGARTRLWHEAALDLMSRVEAKFAADPLPTPEEITTAFYQACAGGQREPAEYLLRRGADINWIPGWGSKKRTPLDVARAYESTVGQRPPAENLVEWLISRGAKSAAELMA